MIKIINALRLLLLIGAAVNPFILFFVGLITLIAGALADDPFQKTAATLPLAYINALVVLGALFYATGAGILLFFAFVALLVYVSLLVRDLVFAKLSIPNKTSSERLLA